MVGLNRHRVRRWAIAIKNPMRRLIGRRGGCRSGARGNGADGAARGRSLSDGERL